MVSPTQKITDFDMLYKQAEESIVLYKDQVNQVLENTRDRYPGKCDDVVFQMADLKERTTAINKIVKDYDGHPEGIADLVRGRFSINNKEQIEILQLELTSGDTPFTVEKFKNQFAEPTDTHFRAGNIQIRLGNGHLAELRVEHGAMLKAAKETHAPYRMVQDIEGKAQREGRHLTPEEKQLHDKHMEEVRTIHDNAAMEAGLDPLLNEKGKEKVNGFREHLNDQGKLAPDASHHNSEPPEVDGKRIKKWAKAGGIATAVVAAAYAGASEAAAGGSAEDVAKAVAANFPGTDVFVPLEEGKTLDALVTAVSYVPGVGNLTMLVRTEDEQAKLEAKFEDTQEVIDALPKDVDALKSLAMNEKTSPDIRHLAEGKMMMEQNRWSFSLSGTRAYFKGKHIVERTADKIYENQEKYDEGGMDAALAAAKAAGGDVQEKTPPDTTAPKTEMEKEEPPQKDAKMENALQQAKDIGYTPNTYPSQKTSVEIPVVPKEVAVVQSREGTEVAQR